MEKTEIQDRIQELRYKGWTVAALADELDVHPMAIHRWVSGDRSPHNEKAVLTLLEKIEKKKRIPKMRRYVPGSRWKTS